MDFEGYAARLLADWRSYLPVWLPGGKLNGHEYMCASIRGGKGESFSINTKNGHWADFADVTYKGGDLISLYAAMNNLKQVEAVYELFPEAKPQPKPVVERTQTITMPPDEAPVPPMVHGRYGKPLASWVYKTWDRKPIFYVGRYEQDGKKQIVPWSWCKELGKFISKSYPDPRPLYGLDLLSERPDAPVLIVEGEKTAEAARSFVGHVYVVVTWANGSQSVNKNDWKPLEGRSLLLWPDADDAGSSAMRRIAELLLPVCPEIKIIDITGHSDGWDAADSGFTWDSFVEWAKPRIKLITMPVESAPVVETKTAEPVKKKIPDISQPVDTEQESDLPSSVYKIWDELGLATAKNGQPITNVDNVLRIFERAEGFKEYVWYDEFHKKYYSKYTGQVKEWTDLDDLNVMAFFQRDLGFSKISDEMVSKAIRVHAYKIKKNEPMDWMETLVWDKKPRIDRFFTDYFGGADNDYTKAASKNWWISMAARIFIPGCKVDTMVILEGAQGKFKSSALSVIGGAWYAEAHESVTSKDFFMLLQGKLILEISELDAFARAEINTIKKVVSCQSDRFRKPYGRTTEDFPRQCVFVATTNEEVYLGDTTGARRFWPVKINEINLDKIRMDREQLFAEAVFRLKDGEKWYEMPGGTADEQESRRRVDEWEPMVEEYLDAQPERYDGIILSEVALKVFGIYPDKLDRTVQNRLAKIMRFFGYKAVQVRVGLENKSQRVWKKK